MALAFKEAQVLFAQFVQTGPLHNCISPRGFSGVLLRTQYFYDRRKQKQPPPQQRDEGCVKAPWYHPNCRRLCPPAALCAVTLRCVRLLSPEAPGRLEKPSAGTPCSPKRAFSLGGIVCFSDPIVAICHNLFFHTNGQISPLRSIQIIAWLRHLSSPSQALSCQLSQRERSGRLGRLRVPLRHPDSVYMGYLAVLDGHGRISRIPSINIFFVAHGIANRPVSLHDHRVRFKICRRSEEH